VDDARKKRKPRRRTVADPLKRRPTYPKNDGLHAGTTLRCWILPWGEHCGFDPCGNLEKLEGVRNAVLGGMTATTTNAPPHRAAYTDWNPSDKMEPGESLRVSIALYHRLSTANFYRQIRFGKFTERMVGDMVRVWRTS
jgi:hypothetical protein